MKRHWLSIWLAAGLSLALASCSSGSGDEPDTGETTGAGLESLIAAAKREGNVVIYTAESNAVNSAMAREFQAKYNINVDISNLTTAAQKQRIDASQQAGTPSADVIQHSDSNFFTAPSQADWFVEYNEQALPGWDAFPAAGKNSANNCAIIDYYDVGIAYNTDLVPPDRVPATWEALIDPYWKGKIVLVNPEGSAFVQSWALSLEKKYGTEFVRRLGAQVSGIVDSTKTADQQVAAGAYAVTVPANFASLPEFQEAGAPIGFVTPSDVPGGTSSCMAVMANAEHPAAARLFVSWRLTVEAQNLVCSLYSVSSPLGAAADQCPQLPPTWQLTPQDEVTDDAVVSRIVGALLNK